jgi:hypothetical protein
MATRSVIKVEGFTNAQLYKHYDGYPDGTLPWLEKFNTQFTLRRGEDPSYKFAQLIRSSVFMKDEFSLDESTDTGWGVFGYNDNLGQEFEYLLKSDGTVTYRLIE